MEMESQRAMAKMKKASNESYLSEDECNRCIFNQAGDPFNVPLPMVVNCSDYHILVPCDKKN